MDFNIFEFFKIVHLNAVMETKVLENKNNFNGILDDNNNFEKTSNNEENQKVDINILKSRLKKKEDIILKRNIAILIGCLSLFVIAATYVEYL